jgi:hypothetical protein
VKAEHHFSYANWWNPILWKQIISFRLTDFRTFWGCHRSPGYQLQFGLYTATPPQINPQDPQRGIRFNPAAFEQDQFYFAIFHYRLISLPTNDIDDPGM